MPDVILGFDGSPSARAALEVAIEQAQIGGDKLVAIFADEPPGRVVGEEYREHRLILEQMGSGLLDEAATAARERGVEVETMLVPRRSSRRPGDRFPRARGAADRGRNLQREPLEERHPGLDPAQAPLHIRLARDVRAVQSAGGTLSE